MRNDVTGDRGRSRNSDPPTSQKASEHLDVSGIMGLILRIMRSAKRDGVTAAQVHALTGLDKGSITPRFVQLREQKLAVLKRHGDGNEVKRRDKDGTGRLCQLQRVHIAIEFASPDEL